MDLIELRRRILLSMASGNLPSFVSKMAGGELLYDENKSGNITISHELGTIPKCIVIYRNTGDLTAASMESCLLWCLWVYNPTGQTGAWIKNSITFWTQNGAAFASGQQNSISSGIRNITDEQFDLYLTASRPLKANETYYWLAWY